MHNSIPRVYAQKYSQCRKGQKQVALERKARRNKNFNLIQEVTALWETIRRKDTSAERRGDLVTSVLKKIDGRVAELAASHTASRIVQACVKYGTADQREKILAEVEPKILELSKSPYGRFVVSKMIDMAPKSEIPGEHPSHRLDSRVLPSSSAAEAGDINYCVILLNAGALIYGKARL